MSATGAAPACHDRRVGAATAPLVGRDADVATLRGAVMSARTPGPARLVLVTGEAGIGKTRLADELACAGQSVAGGLEQPERRGGSEGAGDRAGHQRGRDPVPDVGEDLGAEASSKRRSALRRIRFERAREELEEVLGEVGGRLAGAKWKAQGALLEDLDEIRSWFRRTLDRFD